MIGNVGKPNLGSKLKTSFKMNVSRSGAQKAGRVGEVATNNRLFSVRGGGKVHNSSKPSSKKPKSMY